MSTLEEFLAGSEEEAPQPATPPAQAEADSLESFLAQEEPQAPSPAPAAEEPGPAGTSGQGPFSRARQSLDPYARALHPAVSGFMEMVKDNWKVSKELIAFSSEFLVGSPFNALLEGTIRGDMEGAKRALARPWRDRGIWESKDLRDPLDFLKQETLVPEAEVHADPLFTSYREVFEGTVQTVLNPDGTQQQIESQGSMIPMGHIVQRLGAEAMMGYPLVGGLAGLQLYDHALLWSAQDVATQLGKSPDEVLLGEASKNLRDKLIQASNKVANPWIDLFPDVDVPVSTPTGLPGGGIDFIVNPRQAAKEALIGAQKLFSMGPEVSDFIGPEMLLAEIGVAKLGKPVLKGLGRIGVKIGAKILRGGRRDFRKRPPRPPTAQVPQVPSTPRPPAPTSAVIQAGDDVINWKPPPLTETGRVLQMEMDLHLPLQLSQLPTEVGARKARIKDRLYHLVGSPHSMLNNPSLSPDEYNKVLDEAESLEDELVRVLKGEEQELLQRKDIETGEEGLGEGVQGSPRGESLPPRLQVLRDKYLRAERVIREGEEPLYKQITLNGFRTDLGAGEVTPFLNPERTSWTREDIAMLPQGASQLSDFGSIRYVTTRQEQQRQGRKIRPRGEKGFKEREENLVPPVPLASILKIEIDPTTLKMTTPEEIRSLIEMAEAQGIPVVIKPLFLQQSVQEFRPLQ